MARMSLLRRHKLNPAVPVLPVVPSHELMHPRPGLFQIFKPLARICWRELERAKQSLRVRVVIAHTGPAERGRHTQLLQRRQHRRPLHRTAVVRVQSQLILPDALAQTGFANQRRSVFSRLFPMHLPAHNHPAEHVQHHVQAHELPPHRARQVREAADKLTEENDKKRKELLNSLREADLADVLEKVKLHGFTATDLRGALKIKGAKKATPRKSSPRKTTARKSTPRKKAA